MKIGVITPVSHLPGIVELLSTKGQVFYLESASKQEVRQLLLAKNIDTILCNPNQQQYKIDEELLKDTKVTLINTCSTGLNHIDIEYCNAHNITIYSLKTDFELLNKLPSTAELAFGLMLDLMRNITKSNNSVKSTLQWDYVPFIGHQLKDFKVGIVGYGRLGKMMTSYCKAFNAKVYIYDPVESESNVDSIETLFDICDVVSLHVHVSPETVKLINSDLLSRNVKYLVNTSRGEIVDELAVIEALKTNKLSGYAADVIEHEFEDIANSPFFNLDISKENIIFTPHVGGMTKEGQEKAFIWAINKF